MSALFAYVERLSVSQPVCLSVCQSVCLSVCLFSCSHYVTSTDVVECVRTMRLTNVEGSRGLF